ncbi:hypothetical protein RCO27_00690 [Sphingosinicella sp. LHD-64]|uniref:Eco57I restriction-modification methylase domain-containing protein n=1 Tax=Sphingosinicella sp. LHD-64 TaxID=3072139 RepID=UPI00280FA37B|nr:hypothetical protein [Sphingosinicella sp. LHD-64]MDQ8754733.1 hypothetical protein [Sphingosinicella sp. LHD-64]
MLDDVCWTEFTDLRDANLLEPACGNGAFVTEAAIRLVRSFKANARAMEVATLSPAIRAFELHPVEAHAAREALIAALVGEGIDRSVASSLGGTWITTGDFLLADFGDLRFSHAVGNPPYARWSKIPPGLRTSYSEALPAGIAKGDIFLPFLDRTIALLKENGTLGFLCSDRWRFMAFAEAFRRDRLPEIEILKEEKVLPDEVYQRTVDIYPSKLIAKRRTPLPEVAGRAAPGRSLLEAGYRVKVGPALGYTPAYVLTERDAEKIEPELLAPWARASDLIGNSSRTPLWVICLHDEDGRLRNLTEYPKAFDWMRTHRKKLEARSIITEGDPHWYRPIDRVFAAPWRHSKLIVPELARHPQVFLDHTGLIPSHGSYAIIATGNEPIETLHRKLEGDGLAQALRGLTPTVKGGYVRCYKRFLEMIRI